MKYLNVHPFPARMAPELALDKIAELESPSIILDPMVGSGTVLKIGVQKGHRCIGLDMDPLSIAISKATTSRLDEGRLFKLTLNIIAKAKTTKIRDLHLPWIDEETSKFIKYWFAVKQRHELAKLAHAMRKSRAFANSPVEANAIRIALSRLIITKDHGASLARDVSHSRPHRVADKNDFDVLAEFEKSVTQVYRRVSIGVGCRPIIRCGDARKLPWIRKESVDMVMTSPPYLNAIDYMRGHRLSLVWLGYSLAELRAIRSNSIGAERSLDSAECADESADIRIALGKTKKLPSKHQNMIDRYCRDLRMMMGQVSRVLKRDGKAIFVVGNSRLKDVFISNARGLEVAANGAGLKLIEETGRELPAAHRYLPMDNNSALGRRMRTEAVLTFERRQ